MEWGSSAVEEQLGAGWLGWGCSFAEGFEGAGPGEGQFLAAALCIMHELGAPKPRLCRRRHPAPASSLLQAGAPGGRDWGTRVNPGRLQAKPLALSFCKAVYLGGRGAPPSCSTQTSPNSFTQRRRLERKTRKPQIKLREMEVFLARGGQSRRLQGRIGHFPDPPLS